MTKALWTSAECVEATGGAALGAFAATGVCIDSRTIEGGDLFVAVEGPNFDGHAFVAAALEKGAAGVLVHKDIEGLGEAAPVVRVENTLTALNDLAAAARARMSGKVIAVTGSVGKTSTKEALRRCFSRMGRVHATQGNLNNDIGAPLTLARMPRDTDFAVIEMGMNHAGEIRPLSLLAKPHVAVITAIEAAHMGHFKNVGEIADAKAEIFAGVLPGGTVVLNRDNGQFERLLGQVPAGIHVSTFGRHKEAGCRVESELAKPDCSVVNAYFDAVPMTYKITIPGEHWVLNSMAVLATIQAAGGDLAIAGMELAQMEAVKGRGKMIELFIDSDPFTVIDDSYNASPASMKAAFKVLGTQNVGKGGRRLAFLGDMLELGAAAQQLHANLAQSIVDAGVDKVYTAGSLMEALHDALPVDLRGTHYADAAAVAKVVTKLVHPGDVVLIKSSAGSKMAQLVEHLIGAFHEKQIKRKH